MSSKEATYKTCHYNEQKSTRIGGKLTVENKAADRNERLSLYMLKSQADGYEARIYAIKTTLKKKIEYLTELRNSLVEDIDILETAHVDR